MENRSIAFEKKFWEYVGKDIEEKYQGLDHPRDWSGKTAESFRDVMLDELLEKCMSDNNLTRRIIPNFTRSKDLKEQLEEKIPSGRTFSRKFKEEITKESQPSTLNCFSALFGFSSYLTYYMDRARSVSVEQRIRECNDFYLQYSQSFHRSYKLQEIFIAPTLSDQNRRNWRPSLEELIEEHHRILIHSESFTGKTTLLKYLALNAHEEFTILYLPLAQYEGSIIQLIQNIYGLDDEAIQELIYHKPKTILLLDAFDELPVLEWRQYLMDVELSRQPIFRYIITSRSSFLINQNLNTSLQIKIDQYALESVFFLVDRHLQDAGRAISFHNSLRNGARGVKTIDLLKFPWLVVFILELFKEENKLDQQFFLRLPIEIFNRLLIKLREKLQVSELQIQQGAKEVGEFLYGKMKSRNSLVDIIYEGEVSATQIDFLEALAQFGIINVLGLAGPKSREFRFTIPQMSQAFIAYHISLLDPFQLSMELSSIYFTTRFKLIIALATLLKAQRGESISAFLDGNSYAPTDEECITNFAYFFPTYLLTFLPKGCFLPNQGSLQEDINSEGFDSQALSPRNWFDFYFPKMMELIEEDIREEMIIEAQSNLSVEERLNRKVVKAYGKRLLDFLPAFLEKNEAWAEQFWVFLEGQTIEGLSPEYGKSIDKVQPYGVYTNAFKTKFFELLESRDYKLDSYLDALLESPYRVQDLYDNLWHKILPQVDQHYFEVKQKLAPFEYFNRGADFWHNQQNLFTICLLLIIRGNLSEVQLEKLTYFLGKYAFDMDDTAYAKYYLGKFKSVWLSQLWGQLLLKQLKQGFHFYYFSTSFYIADDNLLHHPADHVSQDICLQILEIFLRETERLKAMLIEKGDRLTSSEKFPDALYLDIRGFFLAYLSLVDMPVIKGKVEELFKRFLVLESKGLQISHDHFTILPVYLIQFESQVLLDAIQSNSFCQTWLIIWIEQKLKKESYFQDIACTESYIQKMLGVRDFLLKREGGYEYADEFTSIVMELSRRTNPYEEPRKSKFEECMDEFEKTNDYYELYKACKFEEFEEYLKDKGDPRLLEYAVLHAIHLIKPLFVEKDERTGKLRYRFSI